MPKSIGPEPASSLPDSQSAHGVFVIIDVCGFTPQSAKLGPDATAKYTAHLRDELGKIAAPLHFTAFKTAGDAVFLFRLSTAPGNAARALLDLFLRVGENAAMLSAHGFEFAFRMVAHESHFAIVLDPDGQMEDIAGPQAIRLFRSEKLAAEGQLLITNEASALCHEAATRDGFRIEPVKLDAPLKGLESEGYSPVYYRLRPPISRLSPDDLLPKPYLLRRDTLRTECKEIPVFGKFAKPIPMERNFIQLHLTSAQKSAAPRDWDEFSEGRHQHFRNDYLSTKELYRTVDKAVIFGLPGAGKTTILRYLYHCTLRDDPTARILLVQCASFTPEHMAYLTDPRRANSPENALRAFLAIFLYPGELARTASQADLFTATEVFIQSHKEGRLTVLIDALDEAITEELRHILALWTLDLFRDETKGNKLFLTSRRTHALEPGLDRQVNFDVAALDLADLQTLGTNIFTELGRPDLQKRFVTELPYQPGAIKLGGTPLTGLLLIFYFEARQTWDSRYTIYDRAIKFIILKVWQDAKAHPDRRRLQDIREFFDAIESRDFPTEYPEEHAIFRALTLVGWEALYQSKIVHRRSTRPAILAVFEGWIKDHLDLAATFPPLKKGTHPVTDRAIEWFELLKGENLFLPDEGENLHFIHSTVLEFLSAAHLRELDLDRTQVAFAAARPDRETLDTFPILCGAAWEGAHRLLPILRDHLTAPALAGTLPYRCLTETELAEHRQLEPLIYDRVRQPIERRMDETLSKDWAYQRLSDWLFKSDDPTLKKLTTECGQTVPLIRDTFPKRYTDSEAQRAQLLASEARLTFLKTILHHELRDRFVPKARLQSGGGGIGAFVRTLSGHKGLVTACAWSPDGTRILSSSFDRSLKIWDAQAGREIRTLLGHRNAVTACSWSPDGRHIASGSADCTVKLWDSNSGFERRTLRGHHGDVTACVWSPDGQFILSASKDKTVKLWNSRTGIEVRTFVGHLDEVWTCAFSPDGMQFVSGGKDRTIRLWSSASRQYSRVFAAHTRTVLTSAWEKDGLRFISGSEDGTLKLWRTDSNSVQAERKLGGGPVVGVSTDPISGAIAAATYRPPTDSRPPLLCLLDSELSAEIWRTELHATAQAIAFHGKMIVVAHGHSTLTLWQWTAE